jgi:hypothetical protein
VINFIAPAFKTYPILVPSLIAQSCNDWQLKICHDGPNDLFIRYMAGFNDPRIDCAALDQRLGNFGHPIRNLLLNQLQCHLNDYIIITNHDNYLLPNLVAKVSNCTEDIVIWDCLHNYVNYERLYSYVEFARIDVGCVAVKARIAQEVGWKWMENPSDYLYIKACWQKSNNYKFLPFVFFVHN